jgi:hypothetical protein
LLHVQKGAARALAISLYRKSAPFCLIGAVVSRRTGDRFGSKRASTDAICHEAGADPSREDAELFSMRKIVQPIRYITKTLHRCAKRRTDRLAAFAPMK